MDAVHIPSLVAHLDIPEGALLPVESVPGALLLDELPGFRVFDPGPLPEPLAFAFPALGLAPSPGLQQGARVPRSHPETEHTLRTCARPKFAGLELSQVGAKGASKERGHQDAADPVPESRPAGLGAGGPWGVLGHDAVLRAGDQAGLLQPRRGLKVLADDVLCRRAVRLEYAAHLPGLDALLAAAAARGRTLCPKGPGRDRHALVPGAQTPVVQILVPVTHPEAVALVGGPLALVAVGVQCRPALHVGAPDGPALAAARTAVAAHAAPPGTWKKNISHGSKSGIM